MLNKTFFFLFAFLLFVNFSAQEKNILVEYSATSKSGSTGTGMFLKTTSKSSLFGKLSNLKKNDDKAFEIKKEDNKLYAVPNNTKLVFKDFNNNSMLSNERIVLDNFLLKDSLSIFNWEILSEEKEILGYKCRKAETSFRGRNYVAYFTNEIKKSDGPWKFSGLPGLILEVFSKDNYIHFKAIDIKFNTFQEIENPFEGDKINFSSYNDFKTEYQKIYEQSKTGKTREDGRVVKTEIPKGGIEIYID